VTKKPQNLGN